MPRRTVWAIAVAVAAMVAGLAIVLVGFGALRAPDVSRPACSQLPSKIAVSTALTDHPDLTAQIEAAGAGVHVTSTSPCSDYPDRALVTITYRTKVERTEVDHILTTADGFGVPAELVKN